MLKKSLLAASLALTAMTATAQADNAVEILIDRVHDDFNPTANFFFAADVYLPNELPTTLVGIALPDGTSIELETEEDEPGLWYFEYEYTSFADLKAAANGPWTISVLGTGLYASTFTLNLTDLTEADLFPIPEITSPQSGATGVPADVTITWNDPTGGQADVLFIESEGWNESDDLEQEAISLDGDITLGATSWKPPVDLIEGQNELVIGYFDIDQSRLTPFVNIAGNLPWGVAPINMPLIPNMPVLVIGSENIIGFEVGVEATPCPNDIDGSGEVGFADLLEILSSWGCIDCPERDLDESGTVDFGDLLAVLATWGPCAP